jgi:dedicated sortase system histidine kinase
VTPVVPRLRFSLRTKLALLALLLLALPWVGYRYVKEMERFLLDGQRQALIATARAVATALHERPQLMGLKALPASALRRPTGQPGQSGEEAAAPPRELAPALGADGSAVREIEAILKGLERTTSRIWVVNRELRVLAMAGSLNAAEAPVDGPWWRGLLDRILQPPAEDFEDALDDDALAGGREITSAFLGAPGSRVRNTRDGRVVIVSAAHPIWSGDTVLGAVVVEETTNRILSLRNQALERLLLVTLSGFGMAAALVLWFATRLSSRIRKLRDEAENAVDAQGRISRLAAGSHAGDEIGDLSRSFSALLERLAQHHTYLESMASRLSHELRTPIAVVRSSLENLRLLEVSGDARVYMERAEAGLRRLSRILSRMSEATRLEQGLATTERERVDLRALVAECGNGYRTAYPQQAFEVLLPEGTVWLRGAADLVAQLLDKLVENAVDFSTAGAPIRIALVLRNEAAELSVTNKGPLLPAELHGHLFESMVSGRKGDSSEDPHLGLGLYVARMIAGFHGGTIRAENLAEGDGVRMTAALPLG